MTGFSGGEQTFGAADASAQKSDSYKLTTGAVTEMALPRGLRCIRLGWPHISG